MANKMALVRDINGYPTYGLKFSRAADNYRTTLAASTEQTLTVPDNVTDVIFSFSPGINVFVSQSDTTLTLPGGAFAAAAGELNPVAREVTPGETLRFISDDVAYVVCSFFAR